MKRFAKLLSSFVSAALAVNFIAPAVSVVLADTDNTISSLSETIKAGLQNYDTAINVSSFGLKVDNEENKAESIKRITESISYVRKMPDMFSVQYETSMSIQIGYGADGSYIIKDIVIRYTNTKEEADARLAEVNEKIDDIIAFSGLEEFIDTPVKRYSSGMYVRLAFAVAAHLESEILIADEVLAVGDAAFQKKAIGKMSELSTSEGRTILFVSHHLLLHLFA